MRFKALSAAISALGQAALMGDCSTVGVSGFTLGGGWGKLSKSRRAQRTWANVPGVPSEAPA